MLCWSTVYLLAGLLLYTKNRSALFLAVVNMSTLLVLRFFTDYNYHNFCFVFRNKYSLTVSTDHNGHNESLLHFSVGDAEQVMGLPDQLTGAVADQLTGGVRGVQADLVEKGVGEELVSLVPVISCILITLRDNSSRSNSNILNMTSEKL